MSHNPMGFPLEGILKKQPATRAQTTPEKDTSKHKPRRLITRFFNYWVFAMHSTVPLIKGDMGRRFLLKLRLDFDIRTFFNAQPQARNGMEGFLLGYFFNPNAKNTKIQETDTYPQGIIKIYDRQYGGCSAQLVQR